VKLSLKCHEKWNLRDSTIKTDFEGDPMKVGHKMMWEGDPEMTGTGEQTISEIAINKYLKGEIKFEVPREIEFTQEFNLKEIDSGTEVSWITTVDLGYPFERFLGGMIESNFAPDLEKGLENLKQFVENEKPIGIIEHSIQEIEESRLIYFIRDSVMTMDNMSDKYAELYGELGEFVGMNNIQMAGPPISITVEWNEETNKYVFDAAFPVMEANVDPTGRIQRGATLSGTVLKGTHQGPYDGLYETYTKMFELMEEQGFEYRGLGWEEYMTDLMNTPNEEMITFIYLPVKPKESE
jgi:effector-binding domain-containing protein